MADLKPRNLNQIRARDPQLGDCLNDLVAAHNNVAQQTNAAPVGQIPPPVPHAALKVTGGAGFFAAQITDNSPSSRGKENFLEASEDEAFSAPHVIHLGASQSYYGYLGAKTLHFRSYSAYPTSGPASPIYSMNVSGLGTTQPAITGNGSAAGWGIAPYTTPNIPIR